MKILQRLIDRQHRMPERGRLSERGATAVEYALMVGLISIVIVGGVTGFGLGVVGLFESANANWP